MEGAWVQQPVPAGELLLFAAYLGSPTFAVGTVVFAVMCVKLLNGRLWALKIVSFSVLRLAVSFAMSFVVWMYWPFGFGVMFGFLLLPAVFSEAVTICLARLFMNKTKDI